MKVSPELAFLAEWKSGVFPAQSQDGCGTQIAGLACQDPDQCFSARSSRLLMFPLIQPHLSLLPLGYLGLLLRQRLNTRSTCLHVSNRWQSFLTWALQ